MPRPQRHAKSVGALLALLAVLAAPALALCAEQDPQQQPQQWVANSGGNVGVGGEPPAPVVPETPAAKAPRNDVITDDDPRSMAHRWSSSYMLPADWPEQQPQQQQQQQQQPVPAPDVLPSEKPAAAGGSGCRRLLRALASTGAAAASDREAHVAERRLGGGLRRALRSVWRYRDDDYGYYPPYYNNNYWSGGAYVSPYGGGCAYGPGGAACSRPYGGSWATSSAGGFGGPAIAVASTPKALATSGR